MATLVAITFEDNESRRRADMASTTETARVAARHGVTADNWPWFVALGLACIALGLIALGSTVLFAVVSLVVLGALLVAGGVVALVGAFRAANIAGTILELILAIMLIATGLWLILQPLAGLLAVTGLVASYLFLAGLLKVVFALADRGRGWGWIIVGGLVSMLLAALIWAAWPVSGLFAIGLFIGVDLIVSGVSWIATALAARHIPGVMTTVEGV
jgi:uncharacterized membrane protein HdeD (DUF308 family)